MAKLNFARLETDEAFVAALKNIQTRSNSLQLDVHLFLVSLAARWQKTGDIRPVVKFTNELVGAMGGGMRSNAVKAWVEAFFGFVWNETEGAFVAGTLKASGLDLEKIRNNRWWEFKPEPAYKPMDFRAQIISLVKNAEKRLSKPNDADQIDAEDVRLVKALADGKHLVAAGDVSKISDLSELDALVAALSERRQQLVQVIRAEPAKVAAETRLAAAHDNGDLRAMQAAQRDIDAMEARKRA